MRFLEGSTQALIQVLVSDGFHTSTATSEAFEIASGLPVASIEIPIAGAQVSEDGIVQLRGVGWDPEDGTDVSLEWIVDIDSPAPISLGLGAEIDYPADQLAVGCHSVTLVATDSDTHSATDSVVVAIGPVDCLLGGLFEDGFEDGSTAAWSDTLP